MIISPDRDDFSTILNTLGKLTLGLAGFISLPLIVALIHREFSPLCDFFLTLLIATSLGLFLLTFFPLKKEITWVHAFFSVSFGWMIFSLLGAIPLYLSGHFISFVDAWFESTSGFATTGLILIQDLDHLSLSHNMWRHLTMFIGGQGIILASLSILTKARSVAVGFYIGEARQEKILPNVIGTARFIWKVSFIYLILGVLTYGTVLYLRGVPLIRSFYHGLWLFFASFDTGGFAPQSQNVAYYHSLSLEIATLVFMTLGAINFNFHFWVWTKDRKEIFKNFEIRTFMISMFILTVMLYVPIKAVGSLTLFRQGFYQLLSAHTGCGFASISATALSRYPSLSLLAVIFAMMIGGAVCSTTGAIKLMRVGIIFKSFFTEIKRWMMPFKSVYRDRFHHLQDLILSDKRVKDAYFYCALFLCVYMIGAIIGMFYGYSPMHSLFESVSATANVGLSVGITNAAMPLGLKLVYLFQMWAGRLEFLSVFVTIGFLVTMFKK